MDEDRPRTAEVWRERIKAWQASGQSVRGWCGQNDVPEPAFYWWRRRLGFSPVPRKQRRSPKSSRTERGVGFAEVIVDQSPPVAEPIRLRLGGGRELVLPVAMPVTNVAMLIRAIEGVA